MFPCLTSVDIISHIKFFYEIKIPAYKNQELKIHFRIKLTILASDGGAPALSSEAQLTITILDSNDHAPTVSLTPCSTSENDDQGKNA